MREAGGCYSVREAGGFKDSRFLCHMSSCAGATGSEMDVATTAFSVKIINNRKR